MQLDYIDLHCDTAYELFHQNQQIEQNTLAVSLQDAQGYEHYAQFFAVWSDSTLTDEQAYADFLAISDYFTAQLSRSPACDRIMPVTTAAQLREAWSKNQNAAFLAVEDARLLAGHLERMEELARRGVKYLTLLWGGSSCIGGSHDTEEGLTDFGRAVLESCFDLGIVPDISHASEKSATQVLDIALRRGRPVIASHSNYFSVHPHSRNLREHHLQMICELGGLVGLNLCREHLGERANMESILAHLDYAFRHGAERHVAIGGDLDGASLPNGFCTVGDVSKIADAMMAHGFGETAVRQLFAGNALNFIENNFGNGFNHTEQQ